MCRYRTKEFKRAVKEKLLTQMVSFLTHTKVGRGVAYPDSPVHIRPKITKKKLRPESAAAPERWYRISPKLLQKIAEEIKKLLIVLFKNSLEELRRHDP